MLVCIFMNDIPQKAKNKLVYLVSDHTQYKLMMTVIKKRMFFIQDILNRKIDSGILLFQTELIYFELRMIFESIYLSTLAARKKKFEQLWPKTLKAYAPDEIRKFLKNQGFKLEEHFPYPYEYSNNEVRLLQKPYTEPEIFKLFNKTHQYLHEPNPYKKSWSEREEECSELQKEATAIVKNLWKLLANHVRVSEVDNGEGVMLLCNLQDRKLPVIVSVAVTAK